jgi:hypothetical protein
MSSKGKLDRRFFLKGGSLVILSSIPLLYWSPIFQQSVPTHDYLKSKELTVTRSLLKVWTNEWPLFVNFKNDELYQTELELGLNGVLSVVRSDKRDELILLLKLLSYGPSCFFLTGHFSPWSDPAKVSQILSSWRVSSNLVEKKVYMAFSSLFAASYYGNKLSWSAIGYPGPPDHVTIIEEEKKL